MTDFSINKTSSASDVNSPSSKNSEFEKLKHEYYLFVRKISKSDFANSPTSVQKRGELLNELKRIAQKEALVEELEWIKKEEELLESILNKPESDLPSSAPFYPLSKSADEPMDIEKVLESCKDSKGKFDKNTVKIVLAFKNATQKDEYFIPYIVSKCRDLDGEISPKTIDAIEALTSSGVGAAFLSRTIDSFLSKDKSDEVLDADFCKRMVKVKSFGFENTIALKLTRLLSSGYSDEDTIINAVKKLSSAHISDNAIFDILKALTVNKNGEKTINQESVNSLILIKNTLMKTRANEKNEQQSVISKTNKPIQISHDATSALYMNKDGTFQTVSLEQYGSVKEAKKAYDDLIGQTEDNMLLEFIRKYKNIDGSIDNKYIRIITALRSYGITHEGLFDLTNLCVDSTGSIDRNTLGAINALKLKGAVSKDISEILSAVERNPDGAYNPNGLKTVCDLSSAAIGQPYLTELFPDIQTNSDAKHFIVAASPYFDNKSDLVKLINLLKSDGKNIDKTALEIADDILFSENNDKTETEILDFLAELLRVSKGTEQKASPDAEKVCCSIDVFSPDEVLSLLKHCLDPNGNVDTKLADAVYKLYHEEFGYNEIIEKINACKNENEINYDKLDNMI